jgi:uncharacterized phage-associated protein
MSYVFSPKRAAQAAAVLVKLEPKCEINYMKLIKLLYIADRESIAETKAPITGDDPFAMKHGPVLSRIYDFVMDRDSEGVNVWSEYFETNGLNVHLLGDPGTDELCPYDIKKLQEVFDRHKNDDQWDLEELTHMYKEWQRNDPGRSSRPIPLQHIVDAVGLSNEMDDVLRLQAEAKYFARVLEGDVAR